MSHVRRSLIARSLIAGRKRIDRKRLIIGVLRIVDRLALVIRTPINAAELLIDTVFAQAFESILGILQAVLSVQLLGADGEKTQYAAVEDTPLFSLSVYAQVKVHTAAVSAVFHSPSGISGKGSVCLQAFRRL